jgi:RecA-family ATPase
LAIIPLPDHKALGIPVAELLDADIDPPRWLIEDYVQEGSICILAGPPNAGKTFLAVDWCARLAAKGKTIFIGQNEGGLHGLKTRLARACNAAGIERPPPHFTFRRNLEITLADMQQVRSIAKQLEFHDLIVLDSLASFCPGLNENDAGEMGMVAEALKALCELSGSAVLAIHHTTKAAWRPGEKPGLGDIRGHGAMAGRIDAAFLCKPMEQVGGMVRFELHTVKQRDAEWIPPKAVEVVMTGQSATVTMEPLGDLYKTGTPLDHRNREIEQQVLLALSDNDSEAITANEVCGKTRKSKSDVLSAVRRLHRDGRIVQDFRGRYYRVKAQQPSDPRRGRTFWSTVNRTGRQPGEDDD